MTKNAISHIINAIDIGPNSDLHKAQPITFQSLLNAKKYSANSVEVNLLSAQYIEDHNVVPDYVKKTRDLEKSILDYSTFQKKRKLPLIKDILDRAFEESESTYFIYSNIDISVMPNFYSSIAQLIQEGYDAIAINRRTIPASFNHAKQLPLMYAELGKPHEGIDCFVFSREAYKKYKFYNSFIGSGPVGLCFIANMITYCKKFIWLEDKHLTFHIGDDKSWTSPQLYDYIIENNQQLQQICNNNKEVINKTNPVIKRILEEILTFSQQKTATLQGQKTLNPPANPKHLLHLFSNQDQGKILNYLPPRSKRTLKESLQHFFHKNR